jgi:hypothetical protein
MQRAGKKALAPILDTIRKNDQLTLKYKIREFPIANRLVGLPLASNSVSVSGAPQRPPRTVDHNVSVILNDQVRSRMPLGARGPNRSPRPVKYKVPIGLHDRLRDCAADGAGRPPGGCPTCI